MRSYESNMSLPLKSHWPLVGSFMGLQLTTGLIAWWWLNETAFLMGLIFFSMFVTMFIWWRDLMNEGSFGNQKSLFTVCMQFGVMLFIFSDVMFFFSFFWGYFHSCWIPKKLIWPFFNLQKKIVDPLSIPLLNTCLLLSSGVTVTAFHMDLVMKKNMTSMKLIYTVLLGVIFLFLQLNEYSESTFSFSSGVYGTVFFMLTGFHGLHVMIGVVLLSVSYIRSMKNTLSKMQHVGVEASMWYWHFVDVVWLFLFIFVYSLYGW